MNIIRIGCVAISAMAMTACSTVKMPKIDVIKSPEFSEDAANVAKDYPNVKDAPSQPTDIRSDKQWDKDARAMQSLRSQKSEIEVSDTPSKAETEAEFEALKAKVRAYQKDDPASGPVQGFPDIKPGR